MKKYLHYIRKKYFAPQAMVLMYHSIAEPESDVWDIAVSPANFEQQLQELKKAGNVVPLKELTDGVYNKSLKNNSIAITFDDGYVDNFSTAKPLLEKYNLPATFFIASGYLGQAREFWWDELEHLILFTEQLPLAITITINNILVEVSLDEEATLNKVLWQKHKVWKAFVEKPASKRCRLYLELWQQLKALPEDELLQHLQSIRSWAGVARSVRTGAISMAVEQLQELEQHTLFDIGAHTVTHPALALHKRAYQRQELLLNKSFLEKTLNQTIELLAYPYGSYNGYSMAEAYEAGFKAAFTTEGKVISEGDHPYSLARFQVKNWTGAEFKQQLQLWKSKKLAAEAAV
ncbi:polysaccharide deacetylase family protein [Pontibacter silvestris]|uniref:Polysaccharide deacetylase family protein n=1 Tax=Pontibacter silvestris TaxID=2305183 RepID=A0ABW4WZ71_9BACT|nr:polysaccharide deacetylase family protein [Pontibacter silvestris]MCC9138945.1 polysaccharide deacetylase family protein [Pontibacter silvestris]